jgi:putative thioredoxin
MLDITHQNFEAELINASMQLPVLLDIWAPWCGPCKTLGPLLEKLEVAYAGRFSLGKLNADEQPEIASQLSQMFGVRSIPFCVLFKGGQPVDGFVGALPEAEVRKFLDKHVPSADELAAEEDALAAEELLAEGDTTSALEKLQAAVATNPAQRRRPLRLLARAAERRRARNRSPGLRAGRHKGAARSASGRDRTLDRGLRSGAEGAPGRHARSAARGEQARLRRPLRARAAATSPPAASPRRWTSCSRS